MIKQILEKLQGDKAVYKKFSNLIKIITMNLDSELPLDIKWGKIEDSYFMRESSTLYGTLLVPREYMYPTPIGSPKEIMSVRFYINVDINPNEKVVDVGASIKYEVVGTAFKGRKQKVISSNYTYGFLNNKGAHSIKNALGETVAELKKALYI